MTAPDTLHIVEFADAAGLAVQKAAAFNNFEIGSR